MRIAAAPWSNRRSQRGEGHRLLGHQLLHRIEIRLRMGNADRIPQHVERWPPDGPWITIGVLEIDRRRVERHQVLGQTSSSRVGK